MLCIRTLTILMCMIASSLHAVKIINNSNTQISITRLIFWEVPDDRHPNQIQISINGDNEIEDVAACMVTYKGGQNAFIRLQNHHTIIITDTRHTISSEVRQEQPEHRAKEVTIEQFEEYAQSFYDAVLDSY